MNELLMLEGELSDQLLIFFKEIPKTRKITNFFFEKALMRGEKHQAFMIGDGKFS